MTAALSVVVAVAAVAVCSQATRIRIPQFVTAHLSQGRVVGTAQAASHSRLFYSFKGIPYASPPVGSLRLKDPVKAGSWDGRRDCTHHPHPCPQIRQSIVIGSEDCLYLNVYTPFNPSKMLPVMVYIHGGDFVSGGAADYPPMPIMTKDVVLVVLQYRLGLLGFLSTEDIALPGNLGLKDQTFALLWVKDNIRDLGGNPAQVTIFGDGSGAASAHFHILSPYSKGLFSRAILQSGSSLCPGMLRADHRRTAHRVGLRFGCWDFEDDFDGFELVTCLQRVPPLSLTAALSDFHVWSNQPLVSVPRVDGDYIPQQPAVLLKTGRYNKVDIISGFAQHDGFMKTAPIYRSPHLLQQLQNRPSVIGPVALNFDEEESSHHLAGVSFQYYRGSLDHQGTSTHGRANALTQMFTDRFFAVCHEDTALLHLATNPDNKLYLYEVQHRGLSFHHDSLDLPVDDLWGSHPETAWYLFDGGLEFPLLIQPDDLVLSLSMVQLWTSFATSGIPTPDCYQEFKWRAASESLFHHLVLTPSPAMKEDTRAQVRSFWHSLPTRQNKVLFPDKVGVFKVISKEEMAEKIKAESGTTGFQPMDPTGKDQVTGSGDNRANVTEPKSSQAEAAIGMDGDERRQTDEGASRKVTIGEPKAAAYREDSKVTTAKEDSKVTTEREHPKIATDKGDLKAAADKEDPNAASEKEDSKVVTDEEDPKAFTDKEASKTATDKEASKTATDKEDTKVATAKEDPKAGTNKEDPKTTTDKGDPKAATYKEDPKAATYKEDPKAATYKEDPKAATYKGDPKAAPNKKDPKAATDKGDPKAATDKEDPKAAIYNGDPKAGTDKEDPKTTTDNKSITPAAGGVKKSFHSMIDKLSADYNVKRRKLDYGNIDEILMEYRKSWNKIDSSPPLLQSSMEY